MERVKADIKDFDMNEHAWSTGGFPSSIFKAVEKQVEDAKEELYL